MRTLTKPSVAVIVALAAATTGCSAPVADDGVISVVASTNVYGDLASQVGGDLIEVTSIIDDPSQDPHSFEADARVQLSLSKADVVIENGGGYDPFVGQLLASLDVPGQVVISAVAVSPLEFGDDETGRDDHADHDHADHDHAAGNEHVWYDFATARAVVDAIASELSSLDEGNREHYEGNARDLGERLDGLSDRAEALSAAFAGVGVAVTEAVPLYLLEAVGLHNVTPDAFTQGIEEGSEVSAATLNTTLRLFASGEAALLVYNEQTTSPETEALLAAATDAGIPVVPVTELLPQGEDYVGWMTGILDAVEAALGAG